MAGFNKPSLAGYYVLEVTFGQPQNHLPQTPSSKTNNFNTCVQVGVALYMRLYDE